jgi:hypothetical protein
MDKSNQKKVISSVLLFYIQMKTYHFMTKNYNRHVIVDDYLKLYSKQYDQLVEVLMTNYGRVEMGDYSLNISKINDKNVLDCIGAFQKSIHTLREIYSNDHTILAISDEIAIEASKLLYRLGLTWE